MSWKEKLSRLWQDHSLLMLLCCLVPLLLLAGALYFGVNSSLLYFAFLLLCPLTHFFLMKDRHNRHKPGEEAGQETGAKNCH